MTTKIATRDLELDRAAMLMGPPLETVTQALPAGQLAQPERDELRPAAHHSAAAGGRRVRPMGPATLLRSRGLLDRPWPDASPVPIRFASTGALNRVADATRPRLSCRDAGPSFRAARRLLRHFERNRSDPAPRQSRCLSHLSRPSSTPRGETALSDLPESATAPKLYQLKDRESLVAVPQFLYLLHHTSCLGEIETDAA